MHNVDANCLMKQGTEQDCIRYASDPELCNRVNVRDRHCRIVNVKWLKAVNILSVFEPRPFFPKPWQECERTPVGEVKVMLL